MWLLAIAVALLGSSALQLAGVVDLSKSIYQGPNFTWLSYIVGGFLFGVGMTLGSGCGSKTLIRIGGGNLKSLVVYVFLGIAAYMTLRGLFGAFRVGVLEPVSLDAGAGAGPAVAARGRDRRDQGDLDGGARRVIGGALLAFAYASRDFRASFDYTLGGVVTGLVVVGGWYVSGRLGYIAEDPQTLQEAFVATNTGRMESFSFVSPMAFTLEYLMLWTDKSKIVTYGIASAAGVIAGSAAYALATRSFRWEGFRDAEDTANHIVGGLLMGFGGITALGCTIGQAITGISTLALGSILTFVSIVAGSAATMKSNTGVVQGDLLAGGLIWINPRAAGREDENMFESANLKHHVDKAVYKREAGEAAPGAARRAVRPEAERALPGPDPDRRRRGRRQERDGQPAQRVDGSAPHPHQRLLRALRRGARAARRCGASGARCRPRARSASSSAPGTPCRSSTASCGEISEGEFAREIGEIQRFEKMLSDEGVLLLKYWFHLSKSQQRKRLKELANDPKTRWRVTERDWEYFKLYKQLRQGLRSVPAQDHDRRGALDRGAGRRPALPHAHRRPAPARGDARAARRKAAQAPARQDARRCRRPPTT